MSDDVRAEVRGTLGVLTLARPGALNALDLDMAIALRAQLDAWRTDSRVHAVWLQGDGPKAFCAGGDVKAIVERYVDDPTDAFATAYFEAEYRLDFTLHTYPKPVLVWAHGFVLGGGVGMMLGGAVRIVTDSTRVSMPEIRIGLFPDVGASWFLARQGASGRWLALTAARVTGGDAIDLGLADVFVPEADRDTLFEALTRAEIPSFDAVVGVVAPFIAPSGPRFLPARQGRLAATLQGTDAEIVEIVAGLRDDPDPWIADGARALAQGSPTSARVILAHLRRCRTRSLADVFRADLDLAIQHVRRPDFHAGVRAILIDKGAEPRWARSADAIDDAWIDAHLEPAFDVHPLADLRGLGRHERRAAEPRPAATPEP